MRTLFVVGAVLIPLVLTSGLLALAILALRRWYGIG
jgi:hypothetical protein